MPGYKLEIEGGNARDFLCILCLLLLRAPVQTICGHRCCSSCVKEKRGSSNTFICPIDGTEVTEVFPDRFVERAILGLKCKCEYWENGCDWVGTVKNYEDHASHCEYTKIVCPMEGCGQAISKAFLDDHIDKCDYRRERCADCGEHVIASRLRKHQQTTCTGAKIKCSHCGKDVLRGQLDMHVERECGEVPTPCPFVKIGCAASRPMKKSDKRKHMENAQINHIKYLLNFVLDLSQKLSNSLESGASGNDAAQQEFMEVDVLMDVAMQEAQMLKKRRPPKVVSDSAPQSSDQRYVSLPTSMPGPSWQDSSLSRTIDEITVKIKELEAHFEDRLERLSRNFDAFRDLLKRLEKRVTSCDDLGRNLAVNVADLNERFDYLESTNYSGVLVWPITGFTAKRHDAILGKTTSFYSPYFYTGRHGYKMRLRVYLNGDGMGKGTHISLFFVICMGKYDALLAWPFKHKVKLMMLDQDHEKDVTESFKPDPGSSSFQKPKKAMNIASGCPLFMSLSLLDTHAYVKDDTVFFKAEVDTSI